MRVEALAGKCNVSPFDYCTQRGQIVIETPTTLILGAGSSLHAKYPSGLKLVEMIVERAKTCTAFPNQFTKQEVDSFSDRLWKSGSRSIDTFLEFNPQLAMIGKYFIADVLKNMEQISSLFPLDKHTWYHHLLECMLVDRKPDFGKSKLSIITFNYDRSLEAFLFYSLVNRFNFSRQSAEEMLAKIPIVHVHGILGRFPHVPYEIPHSPDDVLRISSELKIVHESATLAGEFWNPEFKKANELLTRTSRIYFVGFGFHHENIARLKFFNESTTSGKIIRSTYVGTRGLEFFKLQKRLKEHGLKEVLNFPGTPGDINCDDFFEHHASLE